MADGKRESLLDHIKAAVPESTVRTDGELLESFVARREEAAFEQLMRRHGPMVWGVCRRLLTDPDDAEDAFQATFLVLVRKAASVRPRGRVGSWLYRVAYHAALKARAMKARRRAKERQAARPPVQEAREAPRPEWEPLLDQELFLLPEK